MAYIDTAALEMLKKAILGDADFLLPAYKPEPKPASFKDDAQVYMSKLRKRGYQEIGSGCYSTVYQHPRRKDRVIKVCRGGGDSWPVFAMYCADLNAKFGIKLYSYKRHSSFYVATMEFVPHIARKVRHRRDLEATREVLDWCKYNDIRFRKPEDMSSVSNNACISFGMSKVPGLLPFMRLMKRQGLVNDLHDANYGFREDGSLAIFDPSSSSSSTYELDRKYGKVTRYKHGAKHAA